MITICYWLLKIRERGLIFFTLRHFSVTCNAIFIDEIETANVGLKDPECIAATVIAETRLG